MAPESNGDKLTKVGRLLTDAQLYDKTHAALVAAHDGSALGLEVIIRLPDNTCSPPLRIGLDELSPEAAKDEGMAEQRKKRLLAPLVNAFAGKYKKALADARALFDEVTTSG